MRFQSWPIQTLFSRSFFYIHENGDISTLNKIPDFDLMALIFHKATGLDQDEGQMGLEVDISLFESDKATALEHMPYQY